MKILQLVNNKVWGGGEQYVLNLSKALAADGYNVTVVSPRNHEVRDRFSKEGLTTEVINIGGAFDLLSPVRISKLMKAGEGVIVHCHNFKQATVAARARKLSGNDRVKIIVTRHLAKKGKNTPSYKYLFDEIDCLVFVSDFARRVFMEGKPEIDESKVRVLHNGIPDLKVAGSESKSETEAKEKAVLMFHGRITPEKGLDVLVRALGKLKRDDYILRLAGQGKGTDVMPIIKDSRKYGVDKNIDWLGFVEDVGAKIAGADIGIFPSRAPEAFGLSLLEYMRQGKSVITTDSGAQTEIVTNGKEGIIVPAEDADALADAIASLLDNRDRAAEMGRRGRETYEECFSFTKFYRTVTSIYSSLLAR